MICSLLRRFQASTGDDNTKLIRITKELLVSREYDPPEEMDLWITERYPNVYYETSRSFYGDMSETLCLDVDKDGVIETFIEPIVRDDGNEEWIVGYMLMTDEEWFNLKHKLEASSMELNEWKHLEVAT